MAKEKVNNMETENKAVGVNTPERTDDMNETNGFYSEEAAEQEFQEMDQGNDKTDIQEQKHEIKAEEKVGFFKRVTRWFARHWKMLVGIGAVAIVGGVVYVYWMGKKPIKIGTVDDVTKELGSKAEVLDFAEEAKKLADEMVKNPENYEVANF